MRLVQSIPLESLTVSVLNRCYRCWYYRIHFLGKFMTFPFYIGAMLVGAIIRNIMDVQNKEIPMEEISTLGGLPFPYSWVWL